MSRRFQAGKAFDPDLSLSPEQEDLLRVALSSNKPSATLKAKENKFIQALQTPLPRMASSNGNSKHAEQIFDSSSESPDMYQPYNKTSPILGAPAGIDLGESPLLDYDLDDANIDWENAGEDMFGALPGNPNDDDGDLHDKRKNPEAEDEEENGNKRREGDEKSAKKPGRKPLTEPTTKRKAQNRAAQRAFRERKERHLKELETKVEDLEKASETTNHENGRLRAQVERLNMELKEYRKRLSLNGTGGGGSPPSAAAYSSSSRNFYNNSQHNFHFAFPKFGDLPGSNFINNGSLAKSSSLNGTAPRPSPPSIPGVMRANSAGSLGSPLPSLHGLPQAAPNDYVVYQSPTSGMNGIEELNRLFSPSILEAASRSNSTDYMNFNPVNIIPENNGSMNSQPPMSITTSPSISSMSNHGLDSSCGTTPEPSAGSPDTRKGSEAVLNTISEESTDSAKIEPSSDIYKSPKSDVNGIDWMAQQNGGNFDPVLFGDYRDPQDNILNNTFSGSFFNDAFLMQDFSSPFNATDVVSPPKRDLMKETEIQQNGENEKSLSVDKSKLLINCGKLRDRVQNSAKVQSGEIDIDNLCAQLKAKAKCTGEGPSIEQKDVDDILGPELVEHKGPRNMFV